MKWDTTQLKQIEDQELKRIEIETMKAIHSFCESNHLRYYLWGGTLLGAIRHNGFIPWDDDIDIAMPRPDFEKFVRSFDTEEYGVSYCETDDRHPYWHAKVYDKNTIKLENIYRKKGFALGVDVDIFALDTYDDFDVVMKSARWRRHLTTQYRFSLKLGTTSIKRGLIGFYARNIRGFDANKTALAANKEAQAYGAKGSGLMLYADSNLKEPLRLEQSWFAKRILHKFEEEEFYIPSNYDALLRACYGDYMTPPPKEKQVTHHSFAAYYK